MAGGPQFLDGDYGYAITNETQRSFAAPLVDLFSANSAADKTTRCLYRIRLPE
jgi:hypothetical protein